MNLVFRIFELNKENYMFQILEQDSEFSTLIRASRRSRKLSNGWSVAIENVPQISSFTNTVYLRGDMVSHNFIAREFAKKCKSGALQAIKLFSERHNIDMLMVAPDTWRVGTPINRQDYI